jgi:hypothetical protein
MKYFIILLLAAAGGWGGYYLAGHQDLWAGYVPFIHQDKPPATEQKETYAWKVIFRDGAAPYNVGILLMDGKHWRVESTKVGSSKIEVAVSDGLKTVASPPKGSVNGVDPRPIVNELLAQAERISDSEQSKSSEDTDQRDGHTCWKNGITFQGMAVQFWVDSTSGLPVSFDTKVGGLSEDFHISQLDVDFAKRGAEFFNTTHTDPLFTDELDDSLNKDLIASFTHDKSPTSAAAAAPGQTGVAAPAGPLHSHYFLKSPVSLQSPYGTITLPAQTEVRIVSQSGGACRVSAGGQEFDLQSDQILTVPQ